MALAMAMAMANGRPSKNSDLGVGMLATDSMDMKELQKKLFAAILLCDGEFQYSYSYIPQKIGDRFYLTDGRIMFDFPFDESLVDGDLMFVEKVGEKWQFGHRFTQEELKELASLRRPLPDLQKVFCDFRETTAVIPPIEKPDTVDNSAWTWKDSCDECRGSGYVKCNYGHKHDCEDCEGTGVVTARAKTGERHVEIDFDGKPFDFATWYLWLIHQTPNARLVGWKPVEEFAHLLFEFDGGARRSLRIAGRA
jgi:hypothetical protein